MTFASKRKIILPALALTLVISTLFYGYHSDLEGSISKPKGFRSNERHPQQGGTGHNEDREPVTVFDKPVTVFIDKDAASVIPQQTVTVTHTVSSHETSASHNVNLGFGEFVWSPEQVAALQKPLNQPLDFLEQQPAKKSNFPSREERARYETSDHWRGEAANLQSTSEKLFRPYAPSRDQFESKAEWMRQTIVGDFKHGAENIFIMFKTGAETQWSRMPPHFMTTLTRTNNFALYSDAAGSMFGHEIVNILDVLPTVTNDTEEIEATRYWAYQQMHDEHWNWPPEKLQAEGGWETDRYKNIPMLADAYDRNPNCEWYVWMDDDSYVLYDNLARWLDTMDPEEQIYLGSPLGEDVMFAHGGSVIVVSRGVAKALFGEGGVAAGESRQAFLNKWALESKDYCCGDAMLAFCLERELGVTLYKHPMLDNKVRYYGNPFQGESLSSVVQTKDLLCVPLVSWHHVALHDIELLWEYERLWDEDRFITYNDIYRDFMLPYIVDERPNWVMESGHLTTFDDPKKGWNNRHPPASSKENCKRACKMSSGCATWSYREDPQECRLSTDGVTLGVAANQFNGMSGWVTGYDVQRIRQWRSKAECDPLECDKNGVCNDDESTSEGWYLRKLKSADRPAMFSNDTSVP